MDTPEGLRLRLMTLLSLYDLLPYSISNPPNGAPPLSLEQAIGPEALRRCLDAMSRHPPSSLPGELTNILGSRNSNTSSGQSRSSTHALAGSSRTVNYSGHPASNPHPTHLRQ
ncbi:hypothetical protein BJ912DRAFT_976081 [Pholiota molesta]|nr:hypothetical protein BJ912DRAFT_976081 [Pholiota molesta]